MRAHPNVIGSLLRMWEGPHNLVRWYYNNWNRYLSSNQIMEYCLSYGVDPTDSEYGIRIFFDESGYLHIENCRDPLLKLYLEEKMKDWYSWAKSEYREMQGYPPMNVLEIIEKYTKVLKPGFYQTRFKDKVFNFDEETRFWIDELYLPFNHCLPGYVVNTGYPRLNAILIDIINSSNPYFPAFFESFGSSR